MNKNLIIDVYFNPKFCYDEEVDNLLETGIRRYEGIEEIIILAVPDIWKDLDLPFSYILRKLVGYTLDHLTGKNQFDLDFYAYLQGNICKVRWIIKDVDYIIQNKKFYINLPKKSQLTIYEGRKLND